MTFKLMRRQFVCGMAGFAAASMLPLPASAADTIDLGFLMPLTGGSGKLGNMMMAGAALAVDELNAGGGVEGRQLRLLAEDSQSLARNGIDGYRKLVDVDGARIIVTGWTAVVVGVVPLAEQDGVYLLSASTASPAVRGISPNFQSTWMYADDSAEQILPYARDALKVSKLGILTIVSDLGTGVSKVIRKAWTDLGGEITVEETHQIDESNFRAVMLKMIAAAPEAIYITTSTGKQSAQIVRQARELGYEGYFLSFGAFEDPEVLAIGDKATKCFFSTPGFDASTTDPKGKAFVNAFAAKNGGVPNVHQANHYDLIKLYAGIIGGMVKAGQEVTADNFRAAFKAGFPTYEGVGGSYVFNFEDGSVRRSDFVKTVADGKFVKVADLK
ncbi:ABC transporter substrate-binding protein [Mesorhizobium sp. YR577]|uniref:ABC transporter substrate-binding protein n=1 Tax=Mesorhizobium sp. YR577 TaxID=1884373 RepID=UPI0008F3D92C|nr:ABC transporter substrate-binding protein [Mesorhizobium sp. YR577]SFU21808.1 amino acid/amide ABC transporter substrate-binding protein, HAAT family [Mesorhizobium sp. YR577]